MFMSKELQYEVFIIFKEIRWKYIKAQAAKWSILICVTRYIFVLIHKFRHA